MRFLLLLWLLVTTFACACEVTDDRGNKIVLTASAKRIVSLSPDITEILYFLGAGNKIIGTVKGSDYPLDAKSIPIVADYAHVDREKLLILKPDLIVAWDVGHIPQQLKQLPFPVYLNHPRHLADIANTIKNLSCLLGIEPQGKVAAQEFLDRLQQIKQHYHSDHSKTVFFQVGNFPLLTVNSQSWINELINLCGGKNVFADALSITPKVNVEMVLLKNPEVILGTQKDPKWKDFWKHWDKITAVKNNQLYSLDADLIERPGPRILDGAEQLCKLLSDKME